MSEKGIRDTFCVVSFLVGFGWLAYIDWRIAACVLMTHWANNALSGRG